MRTIITPNNNGQDTATETNEKISTSPQRHSGHEHGMAAFSSRADSSHSVQPAEEDMYDPDLAVDYSGTRGYMLQPG